MLYLEYVQTLYKTLYIVTVPEFFPLLGCYAPLIGRSAISGQPIDPIFKGPAMQEECTLLVTNKHRNGSLNCIIVSLLASGTDGIFGSYF
jgi:hypothetical protein